MSRFDALGLLNEATKMEASIDVKLLLSEVMNAFGGPTHFANEFVHCIRQAEDGSAVKTNAMSTVAKLLVSFGYVEQGEGLTDEESVQAQLQAELAAANGNGR